MLGFAFQHGLIPLAEASILRAIELNAVAVEANKLNDQVLVRTYDREWRDIAR